MARTSHPVELPLRLDRRAHGSLPDQLAAQMRDLVAAGTLSPGQTLPSTRSIAARLEVSRGTVVTAFEQLVAEGYLESERGSGTVVSPALRNLPRPTASPRGRPGGDAARGIPGGRGTSARPGNPAARGRPGTRANPAGRANPARPRPAASSAPIDLRPGASQGIALPTPQWRAAWRDAAARAGAWEEPDPLGSPVFREALAERLRRVRAVGADPADLVITAGARDALHLVLTVLRARHGRRLRIAFESPGYPSLRRVPELTGDAVVPAPVDAQGVDPAQLPPGIDALVVTPSHQYPSGASLPVERRLAVLALARERGFLVIEDEHTAEWRWTGAPLPALAGLDDPGRPVVAMLGSLSSLIHPGIAVGFALLPPVLLPGVREVRRALPGSVNSVAQAALAEFVGSGALDRHLQGARSVNRRRLSRVREVLGASEVLDLQPVPGGLQAMVRLRVPTEARLLDACLSLGVRVTGLGDYWLGAEAGGTRGVAVGFGVPDARLEQGLSRLVAAAESLMSTAEDVV